MNDYRVIYINDCAAWANQASPVSWLLNLIVSDFAEDEDVVNFCKETPFSIQGLQNLFQFIPDYCNNKGYKLLAIFDQHNGLTNEQRNSFPFNLVENQLPSWWRMKKNSLVVIIASSNNSYFLKEAANAVWPTLNLCDRFSDQEFKLYITKYLPNFDVDRLIELTSQVPHELYLIYKLYLEQQEDKVFTSQQTVQIPRQNNQYFEQILQQYSEQRTNQFLDIQKSFGENLNENMRNLCKQAAIYLDLGIPVPSSDFVQLNNILMYYETVDNKKYIRAITPLAKEVVIDFWKKFWKNDMATTIQFVLNEMFFTNDVKGRVVEYYILKKIEEQKEFALKYRKLLKNGTLSTQLKSLHIKDITTVHFSPKATCSARISTSDWKGNILFIPDIPNYDALLWCEHKNTLFPIQITVLNPLKNHRNQFFEMKNTRNPWSQWKNEIIGKTRKEPQVNQIFIWIGNNLIHNSEWEKQETQSISLFSDYYSSFPLLENLKLH